MMYCSDCCFQTDVVLDHATGDAICSNCGIVLDSHCIDETSEWRTFSDENADDRIRVGAATNPLLSGGGLSTVMAKPYGEVLRCHIRINDPDQGLLMAFKTIETMCDSFGLVPSIKARANEMYKALEEQKCSRVLRNQNAVLAACLYIACRQEDKPRTLKEILSVANGTSKKEIGRANVFITKQLRLVEKPAAGRGQESHSYAGEYMRRFCSALGLTDQAIRAAQEAVHKSYDFDIRRSPVSIAAAVIYIITQISEDGHKKSLKDIADVTGVAPATIKSSYKDLSSHVSKLIPDWPSSIFVKKCC